MNYLASRGFVSRREIRLRELYLQCGDLLDELMEITCMDTRALGLRWGNEEVVRLAEDEEGVALERYRRYYAEPLLHDEDVP